MSDSRLTLRKIPIDQKVATMLALYLSISSFLPHLFVIPGYQLSVFVAAFAWIFITFIKHPGFFIYGRNFGALLLIIYTAFAPYLFSNGTIGNRYLSHGIMIVFYLVYTYNKKYGYTRSNDNITKITIPFIIYTSIMTLKALVNNPYISRSIKSSGDYSDLIRAQGVGGYELIYFLVLITIILFHSIGTMI